MIGGNETRKKLKSKMVTWLDLWQSSVSVVQHGGGVSSIVHSGRFSDSSVSDILKFADSEVISVIGHHKPHDHPSQLIQRQDVVFSLCFSCSALLVSCQNRWLDFYLVKKRKKHLRTKICNNLFILSNMPGIL